MNIIKIEDAMQVDACIVDTRSPAEFEHDHIPNAINIPIFENNERHEIGKLYKADQQKAFDLGIEYYSKKIPNLVKDIQKLPYKNIVVYCWRGGMRSRAITQLVELMGYKAYQLEGGYKDYRAYVREKLYNYVPKFRFIVLWGNTGTAKTRIIKKLNPAIDLEGLAQHRSSLFGAVGLKPRSQKFFESLLFFELEKLKNEKFVFVEGESKKIGDAIIPDKLYEHIKKGINVKVTASIKTRIKNTVEEYFAEENIQGIKEVIPKLKQKLGKKRIEDMLLWMDEGEYENVAEVLLKEYYDPLYSNTIDNIKYDYEINANDIGRSVSKLRNLFLTL
ncbi:MAG: tRNA 2-selenouridine(34) synthase MnmH [Nanoarchaeota archaeon]